ncbi:unnamed protein product [Rhizoctonia solani]|uniref:BTB domain-containing protein n=1 Tax=Rhizoctonia solani TaxID=456999 RepID=A0A8H3HNI7_9AGAM|nr:unnamed protein product [Rhizoctonia solani]
MALPTLPTTTMTGTSPDSFSITGPVTPTSASAQDTFVCTSDFGVYHVHFPILACASPAFVSLLTPRGSQHMPSCYDIADDSASFCCFLGLVYSRDIPTISTYTGLDHALAVAKKYGLVLSSKLLRGLLLDPESAVHVDKDPWSAFLVSERWGFTNEMNVASRQLVGQLDLADESTLTKLQASESGLKIMTWLVMRQTKLLTFVCSSPLVQPSVGLVCASCYDSTSNWPLLWAQNLYKSLLASGEPPEMFGLASALEVVICQACREAVIGDARAVEAWMRSVREGLKSEELI